MEKKPSGSNADMGRAVEMEEIQKRNRQKCRSLDQIVRSYARQNMMNDEHKSIGSPRKSTGLVKNQQRKFFHHFIIILFCFYLWFHFDFGFLIFDLLLLLFVL